MLTGISTQNLAPSVNKTLFIAEITMIGIKYNRCKDYKRYRDKEITNITMITKITKITRVTGIRDNRY